MHIAPDVAMIAGTSGCCECERAHRAVQRLDHEVGLSEAECGSLRLPAEWEMGMLDQHRRGETGSSARPARSANGRSPAAEQAANTAAPSKRGRQSQSIDPSRPTRAVVWLLPMIP